MNIFKTFFVLTILCLFNSCGKSEEIASPDLAEIKKFSTIDGISLGANVDAVQNAELVEKEGIYNVYKCTGKEVNTLGGVIYLYVKDGQIKKIMFSSSETFMGSTSVAHIVFDEMYNERKKWIQDAMVYYEIPEWEEAANKAFYTRNKIVHLPSLEKNDFFGMQTGWVLKYTITSNEEITSEANRIKNDLQF